MTYESVIGLEVHLQLSTASKLFCGCPTAFGAPPNSQVCPVCLGLPGVLPVLNARALAWGLRVGTALGCRIAEVMKFDRKQYFYPDLPKNYQISQYDRPLASGGGLMIAAADGPKRVGLTRIHLEEDAGKSLHDAHATATCVDYNRTGVPLLEIVSEPDLRSAAEAYEYLTELKAVLEYLQVSTCNMEEGSLRCDTNVSLRRPGAAAFGAKVEVKNLNSFRAVKLALEHEIARQAAVLDQGGTIAQETRLWDAKALRTEPMRSKEGAADYRYFPEPDLVPFTIARDAVEAARGALPELPAQRRARVETAYGLSAYDARVLTQSRGLADLFEGAIRLGAAPKAAANWLIGDFSAHLNAKGLAPDQAPLTPARLAALIGLIASGRLSGRMAKEVFAEMLARDCDPDALVETRGLQQIVETGPLEAVAEAVLRANEKSVRDFLGGKETAFTFLMGQAMKESKGRANPQQIREVLQRKLERIRSSQAGVQAE